MKARSAATRHCRAPIRGLGGGGRVDAGGRLDRSRLAARQGRASRQLLKTIDGRNQFYTRKLDAGVDVALLRFPDDF